MPLIQSAAKSFGAQWKSACLVCNPNNTPAITAPTWTDYSSGIENSVINKIICPPGSGPIIAIWDRPFLRKSSPDSFPTFYAPYTGRSGNNGNLVQGFSVDWVTGASNIIVGIANYSIDRSGYATDGLATSSSWTIFPSATPSGSNTHNSGSIAAPGTTDIAWVGSGNPSTTLYSSVNGRDVVGRSDGRSCSRPMSPTTMTIPPTS